MKLRHRLTDTEEHIQKSLATLSHGRTMLVIAHRLSTITAANRILVLQESQLVESGTHEELLTMKAAMPTCGANKSGRKPKPRYKARENYLQRDQTNVPMALVIQLDQLGLET